MGRASLVDVNAKQREWRPMEPGRESRRWELRVLPGP